MGAFTEAHGGALNNLYLGEGAAEKEKLKARDYPSWDLTERQLCDVEMLLDGTFSPLEGFLSRTDYNSVLDTMRLSGGPIWPIPITLDVTPEFVSDDEGHSSSKYLAIGSGKCSRISC